MVLFLYKLAYDLTNSYCLIQSQPFNHFLRNINFRLLKILLIFRQPEEGFFLPGTKFYWLLFF